MNEEKQIELEIRKANNRDNLVQIAELIYNTDEYIYPYWFVNIEKCKEELPQLLLEDKFFFNINNLYLAIDKLSGKIAGVTCIVDKSTNLDYDYSELRNKNERYKFTIDNYITGLISEVKEANFAYISNVCVSSNYRGKGIGKKMIAQIIEIYKNKYFKEIALDVLAENPGAIRLYQNLGFEQSSDIFEGFNAPNKDKPEVFSMRSKI